MSTIPGMSGIYPVTIVRDRYGGTYSGADWLAFPSDPGDLPPDAFADDVTTAVFWADVGGRPIGRGASPDAAYDDLLRRLGVTS